MPAHHWLNRLAELSARFAHLGITPELASLSADELWGLYRHLSQLSEAES